MKTTTKELVDTLNLFAKAKENTYVKMEYNTEVAELVLSTWNNNTTIIKPLVVWNRKSDTENFAVYINTTEIKRVVKALQFFGMDMNITLKDNKQLLLEEDNKHILVPLVLEPYSKGGQEKPTEFNREVAVSNSEMLCSILTKVRKFASTTKNLRPLLEGVAFDTHKAYGTNSYILCKILTSDAFNTSGGQILKLIQMHNTQVDLLLSVKQRIETIQQTVNEKSVMQGTWFNCSEGLTFYFKQTEGDYPDVERLLHPNADLKITYNTKKYSDVNKFTIASLEEDKYPIFNGHELTWDGGGIKLDIESSSKDIPTTLEYCYNPKLLKTCLDVVDTETFTMSMYTDTNVKPITITQAEGLDMTVLFLPMRVIK